MVAENYEVRHAEALSVICTTACNELNAKGLGEGRGYDQKLRDVLLNGPWTDTSDRPTAEVCIALAYYRGCLGERAYGNADKAELLRQLMLGTMFQHWIADHPFRPELAAAVNDLVTEETIALLEASQAEAIFESTRLETWWTALCYDAQHRSLSARALEKESSEGDLLPQAIWSLLNRIPLAEAVEAMEC